MKHLKLGLWLVILLLLAVLIAQNVDNLLRSTFFNLDLKIVQYSTPELPVGIFYLIFLAIGFLIAYFFSLFDRFNANRTIKQLNSAIDGHLETIAQLKRQIAELEKDRSEAEAPAPQAVMAPEAAEQS